jgi:hypothetical protein
MPSDVEATVVEAARKQATLALKMLQGYVFQDPRGPEGQATRTRATVVPRPHSGEVLLAKETAGYLADIAKGLKRLNNLVAAGLESYGVELPLESESEASDIGAEDGEEA